jgi:Queuosine salvage protein
MVVTDSLREACAWVAARSTMVRVVDDRIPEYAQHLGDLKDPTVSTRARYSRSAVQREHDAAFWLTLDAINFGSGWFPTLRKRQEPTGYRTIAAGVRRRFEREGRWSAPELADLSTAELAEWLDQEPEHELIGLMVESLNDLGANVRRLYGRSFAAVVDAADGSAVKLVGALARWRSFADASVYDGREVPFLKRAQLAAADLQRNGVAQFGDLDRLTMFADNLVAHVLRLDGILWFDPELTARIERGELIEHGSPEEVEIRACAVHAVELLAAAWPSGANAAQIDELLWNRGQAPEYKAAPRHRSRTTAY